MPTTHLTRETLAARKPPRGRKGAPALIGEEVQRTGAGFATATADAIATALIDATAAARTAAIAARTATIAHRERLAAIAAAEANYEPGADTRTETPRQLTRRSARKSDATTQPTGRDRILRQDAGRDYTPNTRRYAFAAIGTDGHPAAIAWHPTYAEVTAAALDRDSRVNLLRRCPEPKKVIRFATWYASDTVDVDGNTPETLLTGACERYDAMAFAVVAACASAPDAPPIGIGDIMAPVWVTDAANALEARKARSRANDAARAHAKAAAAAWRAAHRAV